MTTHTDRIKQMAQEAGCAWIDGGGLPRPSIIDYADLTPNLTRFAQLVAEDCARVAYGKVAEGLAHNAHVEIRARYSLKD